MDLLDHRDAARCGVATIGRGDEVAAKERASSIEGGSRHGGVSIGIDWHVARQHHGGKLIDAVVGYVLKSKRASRRAKDAGVHGCSESDGVPDDVVSRVGR